MARPETIVEANAGDELDIAYQPPEELNGRIPDWVADIRQALAREDTVLFIAGSRGRAERTGTLRPIVRDQQRPAGP